eukprot:COSAG06_NODE_12732_length_1337_cov_1.474152_2_plen_99_part_00
MRTKRRLKRVLCRTLIPIPPGQTHLLVGEKDKYIALSPQRFTKYSARETELNVTVLGTPEEKVTVEVAMDGKDLEVECVIGAPGASVLHCDASKCVCA